MLSLLFTECFASTIQPSVASGALLETPQGMQVMEVKSGSTFASDWPDAILKWQKLAPDATLTPMIVYGGGGDYVRQGCRVPGWRELQGLGLQVITSNSGL